MRKIIDSHVHFWNPSYLRYEWLDNLPEINKTFLPSDLRKSSMGWDMEKLVFVQADCMPEDGLREVAWVTGLAQVEPRIQGIVAFAPLEQGEGISGYLEKVKTYPLVKGVRRLIQSEEPGFAIRRKFVQGVQQLARYDLSFDICITHLQMEDAVRLVEQCPDVVFVLDHFGKPVIKDQVIEPWATQLRALAEFPHVCCKISGLVTEADHHHWQEADLRPYVEVALEAFGPGRLMFGGDWPVSELAVGYQHWLETAESILSTLPELEKNKIFFENAQRFYGLDG